MKTFGKFEVVKRQWMGDAIYDVRFVNSYFTETTILTAPSREEADMRCERLNAALKNGGGDDL